MSEWRTIDSAPKDGTAILLWGPYSSEPAIGCWRKASGPRRHADWYGRCDGADAIEHMSDFGTEYRVVEYPTHWMPLPDPPESP